MLVTSPSRPNGRFAETYPVEREDPLCPNTTIPAEPRELYESSEQRTEILHIGANVGQRVHAP